MDDFPGNDVWLAHRVARAQRHDFLNDLQVVMGWLQMGRPDDALAYAEAVARRLAAEAEACGRLPEDLAPLLCAALAASPHREPGAALKVSAVPPGLAALREPLRYCLLDAVAHYPHHGRGPGLRVRLTGEGVMVEFAGLGDKTAMFACRLKEAEPLAPLVAAGRAAVLENSPGSVTVHLQSGAKVK